MSGHLIGCVKRLQDLPTSHKLALVAFADSGDDRTHIALPGYEGVQEWAGCSRGRAAELIRDLVAWGYLRHHKRGHRGQRAEYVVFPNGCCDTHRTPVAEEPLDVDTLARAAGIDPDQARLMLTALGHDAPSSKTAEKGSGPTGPNERGKGPGQPDPFHDQAAESAPDSGKGPERIHDPRSNPNAVTPSTNPPTPTGKPAGEPSCSRHPNGHDNCRGCGTTARQRAAAERKAAAAAHRAAQAALVAEQRAARAQALPGPTDTWTAARKRLEQETR